MIDPEPDIIGYLLDETAVASNGLAVTKELLIGEGKLILLAGRCLP
jgi:hypothetical protein